MLKIDKYNTNVNNYQWITIQLETRIFYVEKISS